MSVSFACVRFMAEGFHNWPAAPESRAYLRARHRHVFRVEVRIEVLHEDREIEYHDLLDFCRAIWPGRELGAASCEMIGRVLGEKILYKWPGRELRIEVWEDGEVGAEVRFERVSD